MLRQNFSVSFHTMASPVFGRVIVNCPISDEILILAAPSDKTERDKVKLTFAAIHCFRNIRPRH